MNIPNKNFKVKVGPFSYDVAYSDDVANEGNCFGSTHNNEQKIFLDPNRKGQKIEQTFLHEVLHACSFVSGLAYRFDSKEAKPTEEDTIRELSTVFYQVIVDNPKIFEKGGEK